jgi:general secretion pathway protein N
MTRVAKLAAVVVAAFLVFVVGNAPAALLQHLAPDSVRLAGVEGSLWSGRATSLTIADVQTGPTSWRLSPLQLLIGRVAGNLDAGLPGGFARGNFVLGLGGSVRLTEFSLASPLASLVGAMGMGLPIQNGRLSAEFDVLTLADGWPQSAIGQVRVTEIALVSRGGRPDPGLLASFELSFDVYEVPESGLLEGLLMDRGGPLEVVGRVDLTPPGNYELSGRAAPRPNAPREMTQALVMLGPENPDGGRDFSFAGSL